MKKKLSITFILITFISLTMVTALASTLTWWDYAKVVKQIEHEQGLYAEWQLPEKASLIENLIDMGYIEASDTTEKLFERSTSDREKQEIADTLILTLTGQMDTEEISLDIITYAVLGNENTWTGEQRIQWQAIIDMYRESDSPDILVLPNGSEISETEAVEIAKEAIIKAYELPDDALDHALAVADLYITHVRPDYRRWHIAFDLLDENDANRIEHTYYAIVDADGELIADPDVGMASVEERAERYQQLMAERDAAQVVAKPAIVEIYQRYLEAQNALPYQWPLEVKAEYSALVRPMVQEALESGDLKSFDSPSASPTDRNIILSTVYAYGLPQADDVQETEALALAKQALLENYGQGEDDVLDVYHYYDITDPDSPKWKFVFYPTYQNNSKAEVFHRIELDACSGKVVSTEEFYRFMTVLDYEGQVKWY